MVSPYIHNNEVSRILQWLKHKLILYTDDPVVAPKTNNNYININNNFQVAFITKKQRKSILNTKGTREIVNIVKTSTLQEV